MPWLITHLPSLLLALFAAALFWAVHPALLLGFGVFFFAAVAWRATQP